MPVEGAIDLVVVQSDQAQRRVTNNGTDRQLLEQTRTSLTKTQYQAKRLNLLNDLARDLGQVPTETEAFKVVARQTKAIVDTNPPGNDGGKGEQQQPFHHQDFFFRGARSAAS